MIYGQQPKKSKPDPKGEAPEQVQPEPDAVMMEIAIYVVERDGRVDPNDYNWRLLVLRAKAMLEYKALASGLLPVTREQ
jgi:hypothetical protein